MQKVRLIVTTTFGLEAIVKKELTTLGFDDFVVSDGKIEFDAKLSDIAKCNLWLRTADRVLVKIAEFQAADFDALFDQTFECAWNDWIPKDGKITVTGKSVKSMLQSVRANQSIVKKAIIKKLQSVFHQERFSETGPEFVIQISILKDVAVLTLDTTGAGLHKRGYRVDTGDVPIRENLAAALVLISFWNRNKMLVDPLCGSGTILIEAAMMGRNIAPGLSRYFMAEDWPAFDNKIWSEARLTARESIRPPGDLKLFGFDIDGCRIEGCRLNAKNGGVDQDIIFKQQDIKDFQLEQDHGMIISNPPYGVKMGEARDVVRIYAALNAALKNKPGWQIYIVTADKSFPLSFKRGKPSKVRKLYNGTIQVNYYQYKK